MNRADMVTGFKRRMLPLVIGAALVFALAAPTAFYVVKRGELLASARADADRIARVILDTAEQRPRLWRYDAGKLAERLEGIGLDPASVVVVRDDRGEDVPLGRASLSPDVPPMIWGQVAVASTSRSIGTVWVGVSAAPLLQSTLQILSAFLVLSVLFGNALYWVPMRAVRAADRRVWQLIEQLTHTLPENERQRIAREFHDGVGQALTAARLYLVALRRHTNNDEVVATIGRQLDEAIDEVRRATRALAPPMLEEMGLGGAIERHCRAFSQTTGLAIHCVVGDATSTLARDLETACYRIVQEALTNVARHSQATQAWVKLSWSDDELTLQIEDDGRGFGAEPKPGGGLGFIRERVELLRGQVHFGARAGGGAAIHLRVPTTGGVA